MPAQVPVPAAEILLDGNKLDNKLMDQLREVQVRDSLLLPDTAVVCFQDPSGELVDDPRFALGASLEVKFGESQKNTLTTAFKGEIVAVEPEFTQDRCIVSMRAYDKGWRLNRARVSRTFHNVSPTDMVKQVGKDAGLSEGELIAGLPVYEFFQQSMETDWEFCWRLARTHNCECVVNDTEFHFRRRAAAAPVATLEWGEALLVFKPRMSGMGQVSKVSVANHDPQTRQAVTGSANTAQLAHASQAVSGRERAIATLGGGDVVVADRVAESSQEADAVAQSTLDRLAGSFVEAQGKVYGNPALRAGVTVRLGKVGQFSGDYVLSQTTHRFAGGSGEYRTSFVISGRTSHSFRDLLRSADDTDWASSLVTGIVTNNNDPQNLGRVRVKFPALGDKIEGGWARVLTPNAGNERGMFYMPQVDDEVVVAFEHGDTRRPLVLGSLYNGKDKVPADLISPSGERKPIFGVKTPDKAHVESTQQMTLRSHEKMIVEVKRDGQGGTGDFKLDAQGNVEQKAAQNFKVEGTQVTVKGSGSVTVEATGGLTLKGATVDIQASGPVNVKGAVINLG